MRREASEGGSGGTNNSTASMYAVAGATVKGRARASSVSSSTRSSNGTGTSTTSTRKTTPYVFFEMLLHAARREFSRRD